MDDITVLVNLIIKTLRANYGKSFDELNNIFSSRNYEIRLAGETARDIIMNKIPNKLELVSSASYFQMKRLFTKRKIPIKIDENGATVTILYRSYKIGTIWPVVGNSSQPTCPGTIKAYWMINAYQRIFTVDSISIDFSGRIYDYFNACDDITNCHVRLMNIDPDKLIKNDYLSIFKYFKLFGSLTGPGAGHDEKTLKSIISNVSGLASIKGEVIWSELKTILMHPKRYTCVESLLECGSGPSLGLPENPNLSEFSVIARHSNFEKNPLLGISYMCAFLTTLDDVMQLHERLRLSSYERDLAMFLVKYKAATRQIDDLMYYRQMCLLPSGNNKNICREYVLELLKYHNKKILFENLLLMPLPSRVVDPVDLQSKKNQLRRIIGQSTDETHDASNERDDNTDVMKGPLYVHKKWSAMKNESSKKKQRLQ